MLRTTKRQLMSAVCGGVGGRGGCWWRVFSIKSRQWAIFKTSAIKGEGLFEGLDWLANTLSA
jgi:hypothetical protein